MGTQETNIVALVLTNPRKRVTTGSERPLWKSPSPRLRTLSPRERSIGLKEIESSLQLHEPHVRNVSVIEYLLQAPISSVFNSAMIARVNEPGGSPSFTKQTRGSGPETHSLLGGGAGPHLVSISVLRCPRRRVDPLHCKPRQRN